MSRPAWIVIAAATLVGLVLYRVCAPTRDPAPQSQIEAAAAHRPSKVVTATLETNADRPKREVKQVDVAPGAGSTGCRFTASCQREDGVAVSGASFSLFQGEAWVPAAVTQTGPDYSISVPEAIGLVTITARAPGCADAIQTLNGCPGAPLTIRMVEECPLEGRVSRTDSTVPQGFKLIAWPRDLPIHSQLVDLRRLEATPAGVLTCVASPDGHFAFRGAKAKRMYTLFGGGEGAFLADRVTRVVAPRTDLDLRVATGFSAILDVQESTGLLVDLAPANGSQTEFSVLVADVRPMAGRNLEAVLAGLDSGYLQVGSNQMLALACGDQHGTSAGPGRIAIAAPGYSPFAHDFVMNRLDLAPEKVRCVLEPTSSGFGVLHVSIEAGAGCVGSDARPSGRVRLANEDGSSFVMHHSGRSATQTFAHVPFGSYWFTFQADMGDYRFPADRADSLSVVVGAEPTTVSVPMPDASVIELEVVNSQGVPHLGELDLMVGQVSQELGSRGGLMIAGMIPLTFDAPPYLVAVPAPGEWTITVSWPPRDPTVHPQPVDRVEVPAASRVSHMLAIRP